MFSAAVALAFLVVLILPVNAQTQAVSLDQMFVKIWPEYDQPSALVIMNFFLASEVNLPARVTMKIPAAAGEPHSVAVRELDGQLYLLNYELEAAGNWLNVTFTTPFPEIWLEYYDPAIAISGSNRQYSFIWQGDYAVRSFEIEVQQPLTASSVPNAAAYDSIRTGPDGLQYYAINLGDVNAGAAFDWDFAYIKDNDTLSFSNQVAVQPSQPITAQTAGRMPFGELLPWLLASLALILLLLGSFWFFQRRKAEAVRPARHRVRRNRETHEDEDETIYCHSCGKRAAKGDFFCRACGTKLKLET